MFHVKHYLVKICETINIEIVKQNILKSFSFSELCTHVKSIYKYTLQVTGKYFITKYKNKEFTGGCAT